MKKILFILLMSQLYFAKGQSEFIGIINPSTGTDNIIDSIPGEEWIDGVSTFDNNNHRFIFHGTDRSGIKRLYCINAITGAILSQATFTLNICDFQYDNSSNILYALYSATGNILTLASIDIATAAATTITTFTVSGCGGGNTFFDEANHAYIMQNSGSFYSVNVNTGSITITPAPTVFSVMQFDNTTGTPYGFVSGGTSLYLVKINVSNGTYVTIDTLPSGGYNTIELAFDETHHTYIYGNSSNNLYSINVNTGVISSTAFPVGTSMINFEMQYDNSSNILYSLQWGTLPSAAGIEQYKTNTEQVNIYPNPNNGLFNLSISQFDNLKMNHIEIYNVTGECVHRQIAISPNCQIDLSSLNEGVYNISLQSNEGVVNKRLVIVR